MIYRSATKWPLGRLTAEYSDDIRLVRAMCTKNAGHATSYLGLADCNAVAASIKHQSGPNGVVCSALFPGPELDANALCKCVTNREHRLQSHLNNAATEKPSELTCLSHESSPCLYYNLINCTFIDDVHCVDGKKKISGHDLRHGIGPSR